MTLIGLRDQIVVVTGGAGGIGYAIARGFAEHGAKICGADIDAAAGEEAAAALHADGGQAIALPVDTADTLSCQAMAARLSGAWGDCSVLVNNAAIVRRGDIDDDGFLPALRESLAVNLDGCINMVQALLSQLKRSGGRIVNIASTAGLLPSASSPYSLSKSTVVSLTHSLAMDLGRDGIRVNAIAPGVVVGTAITAGLDLDNPFMQRFLARCPTGQPSTPDDIIGPAIFFASAMSNNVTGTVLPVDGGYLVTGMPGRF